MLCESLELFFKNIPCVFCSLRSPVRGERVRAARVFSGGVVQGLRLLKTPGFRLVALRGFLYVLGIVPPV